MKTSDYFPTEFPFTLPTKLDKFVEETVKGIQPLKMEDYYRSRLKESIWKIYQEEDQSEAQTLKRLGNRKTIRNQIDQKKKKKKKQENSVLWKVPMAASIFFFVIFCVSLISCILFQISGNQMIGMFFPIGSPEKEINGVTGITTYGNLIGSSYFWMFTSLLFLVIFFSLTFYLRRKHKK